MATPNCSGPSSAANPSHGTAGAAAIKIAHPEAYMAAADRLEAKSAQLYGLTATLYGDGLTELRSYSDEIQDQIMWLVSDLACEIRQLLTNLSDARRGKGGAA